MADVAGPSTGRGGGCGCGGVSIDLDRFVQHACGISRKKAKKLVQTGCVSVGGQVNMDRAHPLNEPTLVAIFDEVCLFFFFFCIADCDDFRSI